MPFTTSSGVRIHFRVAGSGPPLVLIHGYTASARTQWELPGYIGLLEAKHRLLLVDLRGHGESEKPHSPEHYSLALMAEDVLAAMDAAAIERADVIGYSMGAMVTMRLLLGHAERFDRAVLGGMGAAFPASSRENCRDEEGPDAHASLPNPWDTARSWTYFLRHYDFRAMRALRERTFAEGPVDVASLGEIEHPVLSISGSRDRFCPGTRLLAERIPNCERVVIPGPGHIRAVRDRRFKQAVQGFLSETPSRFA